MKKERNKALTVQVITQYKPRAMAFDGRWAASFGQPEMSGAWLVWGNSGNGKTRFALQLAKYLCRFGRVIYDSLEEGLSLSLQRAIIETNMQEVSRRFSLLDKEPVEELIKRLDKQKSPDVVIIDSLQYSGMNYADYRRLRDGFRNKLFIILSHADGRHPAGRTAKSVRFDANVKVFIEGYRANPVSRYGGGETFVVWNEGATKYWGVDLMN